MQPDVPPEERPPTPPDAGPSPPPRGRLGRRATRIGAAVAAAILALTLLDVVAGTLRTSTDAHLLVTAPAVPSRGHSSCSPATRCRVSG